MTDAVLAAYLYTTRNTLSNWRKQYPDAPKSKDVFEWDDFLRRHALVPCPTGRPAVFRDCFTYIAEAQLMIARAQVRLKKLSPRAAQEFGDIQRNEVLPLFEKLYDRVESAAV